ncbi:MAG: hypothetical protein JWR69_3757, partial [Pedosphaera sp.]|nr:hypothetical protein [Pedosphaera sp.]
QAQVFPALFRRFTPGRSGEAVMEESEASCFYHPQKKAVLPCEGCGRFLCALCDCELNGQHLCPSCLEGGRKKKKIKSLENHRILYDRAALALAVYPMLIFYLTIVTAPIAIFLAIRHWNTPTSIIHRTKIRYVIALTIATLQIIGWVAMIYFIFHFKPQRR